MVEILSLVTAFDKFDVVDESVDVGLSLLLYLLVCHVKLFVELGVICGDLELWEVHHARL